MTSSVKRERALVVLPLLIPAVLAGGVVAAEAGSGAWLERDLRSAVATVLPDARVTDTNVRGRPWVMSRLDNRISTAYVDLAAGDGVVERRLLVQELDLDSGRAEHLRYFVTIPYAEGVAGTPVTDEVGAFTDRAKVNGTEVTYRARLSGGAIRVTTSSGPAPRSVAAPALDGMELAGEPSATESGILVELVSRDARMVRS